MASHILFWFPIAVMCINKAWCVLHKQSCYCNNAHPIVSHFCSFFLQAANCLSLFPPLKFWVPDLREIHVFLSFIFCCRVKLCSVPTNMWVSKLPKQLWTTYPTGILCPKRGILATVLNSTDNSIVPQSRKGRHIEALSVQPLTFINIQQELLSEY